jgi:hypothetical protein
MTQNTPSPQENEGQLREIALRLLAPAFRQETGDAQLLAGRLPASLPFAFPLPEKSRIVGSFISSPETMQIVLDTDQSPAEIVAFYTERMQVAGWSEPDALRRQRQHREGGFVDSFHRPVIYVTFCKGQRGPALGVFVFKEEEKSGKTEVRLHIDARSHFSPCMQASEIFMDVSRLIPPLQPPMGVQQHADGGSNSESAATFATLDIQDELALPELSSHYARQLEQAGWQRTGEGSSELIAWHIWEFSAKEDERWRGVFTLQHVPGMGQQYYAQMHINWIGRQSQSVSENEGSH